MQEAARACPLSPSHTPPASPTFQQLPELLLLLGDLVQEELGVEVPDFGWRQAATCTVLGPVGDRGRRGEVRDRTHTGEGLDPPRAPSHTPSKAKSLPLGGSRDLPPSTTTRTLPQQLRAAPQPPGSSSIPSPAPPPSHNIPLPPQTRFPPVLTCPLRFSQTWCSRRGRRSPGQ